MQYPIVSACLASPLAARSSASSGTSKRIAESGFVGSITSSSSMTLSPCDLLIRSSDIAHLVCGCAPCHRERMAIWRRRKTDGRQFLVIMRKRGRLSAGPAILRPERLPARLQRTMPSYREHGCHTAAARGCYNVYVKRRALREDNTMSSLKGLMIVVIVLAGGSSLAMALNESTPVGQAPVAGSTHAALQHLAMKNGGIRSGGAGNKQAMHHQGRYKTGQ